uniref:Uncharacterized protein n=1 Tax=Anguilla anguilla TaxID=7936 RepID=A0A0E9WEF6_ANGAN
MMRQEPIDHKVSVKDMSILQAQIYCRTVWPAVCKIVTGSKVSAAGRGLGSTAVNQEAQIVVPI